MTPHIDSDEDYFNAMGYSRYACPTCRDWINYYKPEQPKTCPTCKGECIAASEVEVMIVADAKK